MITIHRTEKTRNYISIDNEIIRNDNLSLDAKGLLIFLLSLPTNWKINVQEIAKHNRDGVTVIYSALNELKNAGHVVEIITRNSNGTIAERNYQVFENPLDSENLNQENETLDKENLKQVNLDKENMTLQNKEYINTKNEKRKSEPQSGSTHLKKLIDIPQTFEDCLGQKLYTYIRKENRITNTKQDYWIKEIRHLLNKGIPKERIRQVIDWLLTEHDDTYTPKLYKAVDFRQKFLRLEDAMNRQKIDVQPETEEFVEPFVEDVLVRLKDLTWPQDCKNKLAIAIQKSYSNFQLYLEKHQKLLKKKETFTNVKSFAIYFERSISFKPIDFLESWFKQVHTRIRNWKNWNGNFDYFIFTYEHEMFAQKGSSVAVEYCHNPKRWSLYIETLNNL